VISLRSVDTGNYEAVIALQVRSDQSAWVGSNLYSLAEAYVFSIYEPLAIYDDDELVGFAMLCRHDEGDGLDYFASSQRPEYWISRFMIADKHQGRGFGRSSLKALLDRLAAAPDCHEVHLGVAHDNEAAIALYRSFGFEIAGELPWGELHGRLAYS
jgi:diamine N-acetyltransferase